MRDGKRLFTAVYVPKNAAAGPYPFLMDRTPYSVAPYGEDQYPKHLGPSDEFEKSGYIFVYQDVRGRWMSEGDYQEMRPHIDDKKFPRDVDDASDTYDTIEFLLQHVANNNGKVGIWGISYPGFYTSASIIDSHPALVAASPQAPMTDLFMGDDAYHGGAFMLSANFGFYVFFYPQKQPQTPRPKVDFDFGTHDGYKFYLQAGNIANLDKLYLKGSNWLFNDQANHWTYDSYWQSRNLSRHMKNVRCAVLVVGGWFDAEDLPAPSAPLTPSTSSIPRRQPRWSKVPGFTAAGRTPTAATWAISSSTRKPANTSAPTSSSLSSSITSRAKARRNPKPWSLRPEPTSGVTSTPGRPGRRAQNPLLPQGRKTQLRPTNRNQRRGRVCQRTPASRALCGLYHRYRAPALHGGRPALLELPARRAGLPDRAA